MQEKTRIRRKLNLSKQILSKLMNSERQDFEIELTYMDWGKQKKHIDCFEIEGYKNAWMIINEYRELAHQIGIEKMNVLVAGRKIQGVTFHKIN